MADPGHVPGPVFIENCVAIRLIWKLANGKLAQNVMHGTSAGNPNFTQGIVDGIWASVLGQFTSTGLASRLDPTTTLQQIGFRYMGSSGTPPVGFGEWLSSTPGLPGTAATPPGPLPPQIALVVSLRTGRSGQANRGRVYIPGWSETANEANGTCVDAAAVDAVDFIVALSSTFGTAGFPLCIAHPQRAAYTSPKPPHAEHGPRPPGTVPVTQVVKLNNAWDTQRLRGRL